jgi:hypothetical protein
VLVLATSASRSHYLRDFLTCLASPSKQVVSFSYRTTWFQPEVYERALKLRGEQAVIVFCAKPVPAATDFQFLPLRHVRITALRPQEVVEKELVNDDTHIAIDFELGDFVNVTDKALADLEEQWEAWMERPTKPTPGASGAHWVMEADALPEAEPVASQYTPWLTLSRRLAEFPDLQEAYFFRVAGLRSREAKSSSSNLDPSSATPDAPLEYELKTNSEYILEVDAYSRAKAWFGDVLEASTSELLTATEAVTSTVGQATSLRFFVGTGSVQRAETAILVLRGTKGYEDTAPRVALVANVKPRYGLIALLLAAVAFGVAFAGFNWSDAGVSDLAAIGLKILGGAIVSVSLFFAARSAPGVAK